MIAVDHFLRGNAFFAGFDSDRHAVLIRSADEKDFLAFRPEITHINIGRDIDSCQVPDMDGAVGIGQGRSYRSPFPFFSFHLKYFSKIIELSGINGGISG